MSSAISGTYSTYHCSEVPDISTVCPASLEKNLWGVKWTRLYIMSVCLWHIARHSNTEVRYVQQTCTLFKRPKVRSGLPDRAAISKNM